MIIWRSMLFLICVVQLIFAVGFFFQWAPMVSLWPFPGTTPLTFIFISSIFAAAAASTFWATASRNYGALAGIALDYFAIMAPLTVFTYQLSLENGGLLAGPMGYFTITVAVGAIFGLGLFLWSARIPIDHPQPMPGLVRGSFVIFILALLYVSTRLILKVPNTIPWKITPELSVVIGWIFLGAALYFIYALARPTLQNSAGQLAGFLAYDLVLIVPFLTRLPNTPSEHLLGLIIYTGVVTFSGLLAIYYLFIHKPTRIVNR